MKLCDVQWITEFPILSKTNGILWKFDLSLSWIIRRNELFFKGALEIRKWGFERIWSPHEKTVISKDVALLTVCDEEMSFFEHSSNGSNWDEILLDYVYRLTVETTVKVLRRLVRRVDLWVGVLQLFSWSPFIMSKVKSSRKEAELIWTFIDTTFFFHISIFEIFFSSFPYSSSIVVTINAEFLSLSLLPAENHAVISPQHS